MASLGYDPFAFLVEKGVNPLGLTEEEAYAQAEQLRLGAAPKVQAPRRPSDLMTKPEKRLVRDAKTEFGEGALQIANEAAQQLKQLAAGGVEMAARAPWDAASFLTSAVEGPLRATGVLDPDIDPEESPTIKLQKLAQRGSEITDKVFAPPASPGQAIARDPMGAAFSPITEGAKSALDALKNVDNSVDKRPVVSDNGLPGSITSDLPTDQEFMDQAHGLLGDELGQEPVATIAGAPPPKAEVANGGVAKISPEEWAWLGAIGVLNIGAAWGPSFYKMLKTTTPPSRRFRPIPGAEQSGAIGFSNRLDLARTYDDANAGILRMAEGIGMPQQVQDRLSHVFETQTRAAANNLGNTAVHTGDMAINNLRFRAPSLTELAKQDSPDFRRYLELRNLHDQIQIPRNMRINPNNPNVNAAIYNAQQRGGRAAVQGMSEQQILAEMNALERANPQLQQFGKQWRDIIKEQRRLASTGEYAIISPRKAREWNTLYKNEIPRKEGQQVGEPPLAPSSPFDALAMDLKSTVRERMENEARGQYIDALRATNPRFARRITQHQYDDNPDWRRNTVTLYRRGKKEYYVTDPLIADTLKFDPYMYSGDDLFMWTKNLFQDATTGKYAIWFAPTSALRTWRQGRVNNPEGFKPPGVLSTFSAIPKQLVPQFVEAIVQSADRGSNGLIGKVFGPQIANSIATKWAHVYEQSIVGQAARMGSVEAPLLQKAYEQGIGKLRQASRGNTQQHAVLRALVDTLSGLGRGYTALTKSIHNAPQHSFLQRNWDNPDREAVIREAQALGGNAQKSGAVWMRDGRRIRSNETERGADSVAERLKNTPLDMYGRIVGAGQHYVPWYNVTVQSMKRLAQAYVENPAKFVMRANLYATLPATLTYLWNYGLSQTEEAKANGWDYNEPVRGMNAWLMNDIIGLPGKPPSESVMIPTLHELAGVGKLATVALDHVFRDTEFTMTEDMMAMLSDWLQVTAVPATPPLIAAGPAMAGLEMPGGPFGGGDVFAPRREGFINDQFPVWFETLSRALGGGAAAVIGDAASAYSNTEDGFVEAVKNAFLQTGESVIKRTPLVRDVMGMHFPISSDNRVNDEMWRKQDALKKFAEYVKKWDKGQGQSNVGASSAAGQLRAEAAMGSELAENIPPDYVGVLPKEPDNPIYLAFQNYVYQAFAKDSGGDLEGYLSMWDLWNDVTPKLAALRRVNKGNLNQWKREMEGRPDELRYLRDHGVQNPLDPYEVQNYYTRLRNERSKAILRYIHEAETRMTASLQDFRARGLDRVLDPEEAGMTPEQMNLWLALQVLSQNGQSLPDQVRIEDVVPYLK